MDIIPLIELLEIRDIFKDKARKERDSIRTNLIARVSRIQGHEIHIVLYARLDNNNY